VTSPRAARVYGGLLRRLYPRRFRDEYGADMVLLFAEQLRDEPAMRVWARGVIDLAITVPARHLEAHMTRLPNPTVPALLGAVTVAGVLFGIITGSNLGILAAGLSVAAVAGALAVVAWRHTRAITTARPATAHWWKLLAGGAGVLGAVTVVTTATGEVDESMWWPMIVTILGALVTLAAGGVLGIAHLTATRPPNAPSRPHQLGPNPHR
jgi:hypothetical protein